MEMIGAALMIWAMGWTLVQLAKISNGCLK